MRLDQSGKRRLLGFGVQRKLVAKSIDPSQATLLNGFVLGIQQSIGDHISHLSEGISIDKGSTARTSNREPPCKDQDGESQASQHKSAMPHDVKQINIAIIVEISLEYSICT